MRPRRSPIQMGTVLSRALALVGITEDRVTALFGKCRCRQRAAKLNELSDWAWTMMRGNPEATEVSDEEKRVAEESFKRIEGSQ